VVTRDQEVNDDISIEPEHNYSGMFAAILQSSGINLKHVEADH